MEDYVRKLALWHTKTFKPIMTHDELEPIVSTLGFFGYPPTTNTSGAVWKEYGFNGGACDRISITENENETETETIPLPRPRLPYPRIDGLHQYTYRAFCDAVAFYIGEREFPDHLHVRGMPLHRVHDRPFDKNFRCMNEEDVLYVYREGTLDQETKTLYSSSSNNINTPTENTSIDCRFKRGNNKLYNHRSNKNILLHSNTAKMNIGSHVPLKDIIV